jgi:recombination protein RecT
VEIYEDEYAGQDILSGEVELNPVADGDRAHGRASKIVGYAAYLEFINGFRKTIYWDMDKIKNHAQKFSKSWDQKNGRFFKGSAWDTNFEAMCRKTVLKNALSSWGILSTQMQTAIVSDEGVKNNIDSDEIYYPDNPQLSYEDAETEESDQVSDPAPEEQEATNPATQPPDEDVDALFS